MTKTNKERRMIEGTVFGFRGERARTRFILRHRDALKVRGLYLQTLDTGNLRVHRISEVEEMFARFK